MVVFAADYPFMDVLWTMVIFFAWVVWLWMIFAIFGDLFRRQDVGGWGKAAWVVFMILLPFVGVLAYLITQHDAMAKRTVEQVQAQQNVFDEHVREVAARNGAGPASEIEKAQRLLEKGAIDQAEFDAIKAKALAAA